MCVCGGGGGGGGGEGVWEEGGEGEGVFKTVLPCQGFIGEVEHHCAALWGGGGM